FGYGAFRTISGNFAVPSSGNYVEGNIPPIQSGQAFYIQTTANPGAISFAENAKVKGTSHIFREANTIGDPDAQLRVNMYALPGNVSVLIDVTLSLFHPEYAANMNEWDARKVMNPAENIGIAHASAILSIERRLMPAPNDTLFY